jgi:hypothetical protein
MGERRVAYRVLEWKPERKGLLGRPRLSWEDNIKVDLQDVGWRFIDWIDLAQGMDSWRDLVIFRWAIPVVYSITGNK